MDICIHLFTASVTLTGFIAVFLVFRYQTIDRYVDNRKGIMRELLKDSIKNNHKIVERIQDLGKWPEDDELIFFKKYGETILKFVKIIRKFREHRQYLICFGRSLIIAWSLVSLLYLILFASCSSFYIPSAWFIIKIISVIFFIWLMMSTLIFICEALKTRTKYDDI